jgi:hypothetical protein
VGRISYIRPEADSITGRADVGFLYPSQAENTMTVSYKSKTPILGAACAALVVLAAGCGPTITSDRDQSLPIPQGATYVWHGGADLSQQQVDPNIQNDIVQQRIINAIDAQMKAKGFVLTTDSATAYFAVRYFMALQKSTQMVTTTTGVGYYGGYYGGYGYGWGGGYAGGISTTTPVTSTDGGVVIDLLQNSTGKLVWRGQVTGEVGSQAPSEQRVNQVTAEVMATLKADKSGEKK